MVNCFRNLRRLGHCCLHTECSRYTIGFFREHAKRRRSHWFNLWLIPIAVGWLQLSPKCNFDRSQAAYDRADRHTRTRDSHIVSSPASTPRALITANKEDVTSPDELLTPPVFNYSRSLQWSSEAETAFQVLKVALQKAQSCIPVRFGRSGSSPTLSRPFTLAICVGLPVKSPRTVPCQKVHSAAIGRLGCSQE